MAEFDASPEVLQELGRLALKVSADKDVGRQFRKLVKKVDPRHQFPADAVEDLRQEMKDAEEARKLQAENERVLAQQAADRAALSARYTEDQIKEIEKIMEKHGLASYDAGAKLYAADLKPARPSGKDVLKHGATWELPGGKEFLEDPVKAARDAAVAVIDEINARRAA